jgi:stage IV sporulation protein FB
MSDDATNATRGYVRFGSWRGAPFLWHWSLPLGLYVLSGMTFHPARWIAMTLLVLGHELGHAWWVRRYGAEVLSIRLLPFGGLCVWRGEVTERQRSVIAAGGVMVQALVWLVVTVAVRLAPPLPYAWLWDVEYAWTTSNLFMLVVNLLPVAPLDGHEAWQLPTRWLQERAQRMEVARIRAQAAAQRRAREAERLTAVRVDEGATGEPAADVTAEARALAEAMWKRATRPEDG